MEAIGSVDTVLDIWNNVPNAYTFAIVTDKDLMTRSKLDK
jgi:hypothetical protein